MQPVHAKFVCFVALALAVSAPSRQASRLLRGRFDDSGPDGDASGYSATNMARGITTAPSKSKVAATPFDAEASANSNFNGVYRLNSDVGYASYATVEADPWNANPDRKAELIKPRARSAIDVVGSKQINQASGAPQVSALIMGGASVSQTYEGATSAAASDALMVNQGKKRTTISNSMLTASTGRLPSASRSGSFGMTAQPASVMALSGLANGNIQVAQAGNAVALAMTEKRTPMEKKWGVTQSGPMH